MVSIAKVLVFGLNMDIEWFQFLKLTISRVVAPINLNSVLTDNQHPLLQAMGRKSSSPIGTK